MSCDYDYLSATHVMGVTDITTQEDEQQGLRRYDAFISPTTDICRDYCWLVSYTVDQQTGEVKTQLKLRNREETFEDDVCRAWIDEEVVDERDKQILIDYYCVTHRGGDGL